MSEPLYSTIATQLARRIQSGDLQPGDRLPPERAMLRDFEVSRATLRSALGELEQRGLITRHQGRGTFVRSNEPVPNYAGFFSLRDAIAARGLTLETEILNVRTVPVGRQAATDLGIRPGDSAIELTRLRTVQSEPLILETGIYPSALFPGLEELDLSGRSLYETLRTDYQCIVVSARTTLEPVLLTPDEAALLQIGATTPAMMVRRISYDTAGTPVELSSALLRGDRCRYIFEHRISESPQPLEQSHAT